MLSLRFCNDIMVTVLRWKYIMALMPDANKRWNIELYVSKKINLLLKYLNMFIWAHNLIADLITRSLTFLFDGTNKQQTKFVVRT